MKGNTINFKLENAHGVRIEKIFPNLVHIHNFDTHNNCGRIIVTYVDFRRKCQNKSRPFGQVKGTRSNEADHFVD